MAVSLLPKLLLALLLFHGHVFGAVAKHEIVAREAAVAAASLPTSSVWQEVFIANRPVPTGDLSTDILREAQKAEDGTSSSRSTLGKTSTSSSKTSTTSSKRTTSSIETTFRTSSTPKTASTKISDTPSPTFSEVPQREAAIAAGGVPTTIPSQFYITVKALNPGFLVDSGTFVNDCTQAGVYSIGSSGTLNAGAGYIYCTDGSTPSAQLIPTNNIQSVYAVWKLQNGLLVWSNGLFKNGVATFCVISNNVYAYFTVSPPSNCKVVSLIISDGK